MSLTDPKGYELDTWEKCRTNLVHRLERRRTDLVQGPYFTVSFPAAYTDQALNFVGQYTAGGTLVSVSHRCSGVYDWATQATFNIGLWPHKPHEM